MNIDNTNKNSKRQILIQNESVANSVIMDLEIYQKSVETKGGR